MSSQASIYSQGFNFSSFIQKGVDPRTGQYTCAIAVYETPAQIRNCPSLQLSLVYNPLNTQDTGLGQGWSFNLSSYQHRQAKTLLLSTGENYMVTETSSFVKVKDQKLKSFHFRKNGGRYQVIYKSGQIEVLSNENDTYNTSVPIELYAANGRMLRLVWIRSGEQPRLHKIQDGSQDLLEINYTDAQVTITRFPGTDVARTFRLFRRNKQLQEVRLPLKDTLPWKFEYERLGQVNCMMKITSPAGLVEEVTHKERGHRLPPRAPYQTIPYVISHTVRPGNSQPPIKTTYAYSDRNFLGYGSGYNWKDGEDNLYRAREDYQFMCTMQVDTGAETKYTYNRFHLLVSSRRRQGTKQLTQTVSYYMHSTGAFSDQPPQYQLPKTVKTTYEDTATGKFRTETSQHVFDEWGNPIQDIQPSGIRTDRVYYPPEGENGLCPADPHGFQRYTKTVVVTPALSDYPTAARTRLYTYGQWATATPTYAKYFVAATKEKICQGGDEVYSSEYAYMIQPQSRDHGRHQQETVCLSGQYPTTNTWTYQYTNADHFVETIQTKTFDGYNITAQKVHSLSSGLTVSHTNHAGVRRDFQYDPIDRLAKQTLSAGTPYEAVQSYEYIVPQDQPGYRVTFTNPKGVQTRQFTDGLKRICRIEVQDDDGEYPGSGAYDGSFRVVEERQYNAVGQCVEVKGMDWLRATGEEPKPQCITRSMEYDDWGHVCRVTESNGLVTLTQTDPINMTRTQGIQGEAQMSTQFNIQGSPTQTAILGTDGSIYSKADNVYDGLSRLVKQEDPLGHVTQYEMDQFDRIAQMNWQEDLVMSTEYASHSSSPLPVSTKLDDSTLGTQLFDGLGRVTNQKLGLRTTAASYQGITPKPSEIRTPKGDTHTLTYDVNLGYALTAEQSTDDSNFYEYETRTGEMLQLHGSHTKEQRQYLPSGLLWQEKFAIEKDEFCAYSSYSMAGKLQCYIDVNGQTRDVKYDEFGRPKKLRQGNVRITFKYDRANRLSETHVEDTETSESLITQRAYDEFGRELERTVSRGLELVYRISHTFGKTSLLATRKVEDGSGTILRHEAFQYDSLSRLVEYQCQGTRPPADEKGHALRRQQFTFDKYDNLVQISTTFQDGSQNTEGRLHRAEEPTQLIQITNTHPDYPSQIDLAYDDNGCLTRDEQGRRLEYDTKSHLSVVYDGITGEILSQYYYDASGKLIRQNVQGKDTYMFYRGSSLIALRTTDSWVSYISTGGIYWGQTVRNNNGSQTQLWTSDNQHSLLAWLDTQKPAELYRQEYTPHGFSKGMTSIGFNGQWRDPVTGWYHLGNGYRVYNPVLMRFHSPDDWSPFTSGDINPYVYCLGDPINSTDPTGHFSIFGIHFGWRDLALSVVGIGVGILFGVATGGLGFAIEAGVGIAAGVVSDVATGAIYDAATGKSPTWQSVGNDALFGAIGGVLGEAGGRVLGKGIKAAVAGIRRAFNQSGSVILRAAERRASLALGSLAGDFHEGQLFVPGHGLTEYRGEYVFLDSVDSVAGQEGFVTHGTDRGILYGRGIGPQQGQIVAGSAAHVAQNTIMHEMGLADARFAARGENLQVLRGNRPFYLFACYGADSGAAQQVANVLDRPVIAFRGVLTPREGMGRALAIRRLEQPGGVDAVYGHTIPEIFYPPGREPMEMD